jgi:hypothetical protein
MSHLRFFLTNYPETETPIAARAYRDTCPSVANYFIQSFLSDSYRKPDKSVSAASGRQCPSNATPTVKRRIGAVYLARDGRPSWQYLS